MDTNRPIRVMIVDDHQAVREGLESLLRAVDGIQVVGQAANAREAIRKTAELKPDVLLLDMRLPDCLGLDVCRSLRLQAPDTRVIMLTSYQQESYLVEALKAGAWACLSKTADLEEMVHTVTAVALGRRPSAAPRSEAQVEPLLGR
jgi:DNA-binding NarL/FixJ family response regulator